ncbi:MAG: hypothetical protein ACLT1J_10275 [Mediterraneibacter gnavus]
MTKALDLRRNLELDPRACPATAKLLLLLQGHKVVSDAIHLAENYVLVETWNTASAMTADAYYAATASGYMGKWCCNQCYTRSRASSCWRVITGKGEIDYKKHNSFGTLL